MQAVRSEECMDYSDSDEDHVLEEFGNETGTESDAGNEEIDYKADVDTLPLIVTT